MGPVERRSRPRDAEFSQLRQCAARYVRRGGSGQPWPVGGRAVLWPGLEPLSGSRLGAVPERALGLGRLLWLDLGEFRPLGLGAVSLWPMVLCGAVWMVLVSRRFRTALLVAGHGRFFRIRAGRGRGFRLREYRLGGAGAFRAYLCVVGPRVLRRFSKPG